MAKSSRQDILEAARRALARARRVSVLTGAGVSAESGIPTFRDRGGIWEKFDPQQVATPDAFARDPAFVWEWYALRMRAVQEARPNPAHYAIAELERLKPEFWLVTQNIDNLHRLAGSRRMTELHGNLWRTRCLACGKVEELTEVPQALPPRCAGCGGLRRPDVVWFGEMLDPRHIAEAERACDADLFLIVGTSGEVWPAAGFAHQAKAAGAQLVEINPQPGSLSQLADFPLVGKAGEVLPRLLQGLAGPGQK
ncbi:MAG: NAD-dependent deacylase [bacterium]